ncbi:Hypothetical predicted protein [Mytilus galloprovincialis]|uniref:Fungal lipase-type domain-containing protein n=1 Tax=Mytilus galloprovincialis TaxID=29158 RepID=A0A8B6DPS9_MYTGA|nr:Hypothetical predicted protein [Mytilus galloprovincialis]
MGLVCLLTLLLLLDKCVNGKTKCIEHTSKGCEYCVQQSSWISNCRWCELDHKCHATGSVPPYNPCNKNQVIKDIASCPKLGVVGDYDPHTSYNLLRLSTIPYADTQNGARRCLSSYEIYSYEIVEWIVSAGTGSGEVQKYFKQVHDKLFSCVEASMHDLLSNYPDYNIWITGHSLGGAVAPIASARLVYDGLINKDKMALYTFGIPRVGNRQYAIEHNKLVNNSWRVVHRNDPVPH